MDAGELASAAAGCAVLALRASPLGVRDFSGTAFSVRSWGVAGWSSASARHTSEHAINSARTAGGRKTRFISGTLRNRQPGPFHVAKAERLAVPTARDRGGPDERLPRSVW